MGVDDKSRRPRVDVQPRTRVPMRYLEIPTTFTFNATEMSALKRTATS